MLNKYGLDLSMICSLFDFIRVLDEPVLTVFGADSNLRDHAIGHPILIDGPCCLLLCPLSEFLDACETVPCTVVFRFECPHSTRKNASSHSNFRSPWSFVNTHLCCWPLVSCPSSSSNKRFSYFSHLVDHIIWD